MTAFIHHHGPVRSGPPSRGELVKLQPPRRASPPNRHGQHRPRSTRVFVPHTKGPYKPGMLPPMIHAPTWDRCTSPPRMTVGQGLFALWSADLVPVHPPWNMMLTRNPTPVRFLTPQPTIPKHHPSTTGVPRRKAGTHTVKPHDVASAPWGPRPKTRAGLCVIPFIYQTLSIGAGATPIWARRRSSIIVDTGGEHGDYGTPRLSDRGSRAWRTGGLTPRPSY